MNLALRNMLEAKSGHIKSKTHRVSKVVPAFFLAGITSAINYYFQSVVNSEQNSKVKDIIDKVAK
jgi:hypothetical protein